MYIIHAYQKASLFNTIPDHNEALPMLAKTTLWSRSGYLWMAANPRVWFLQQDFSTCAKAGNIHKCVWG